MHESAIKLKPDHNIIGIFEQGSNLFPITLAYVCPIKKVNADLTFYVSERDAKCYDNAEIIATMPLPSSTVTQKDEDQIKKQTTIEITVIVLVEKMMLSTSMVKKYS